MDHDHVADYFGGDHAMAELFLNIINSDVSSGTALGVGFRSCVLPTCARVSMYLCITAALSSTPCASCSHIPLTASFPRPGNCQKVLSGRR